MHVDLILSCKGRKHHLDQTYPTYACQQHSFFDYGIIVVDYGCPDKINDYYPGIKVEQGTEYFNYARAHNIGASISKADLFMFSDADFMFDKDFVERLVTTLVSNNADLVITGVKEWFSVGCILVTRQAYFAVRGFDEEMVGYGYNDVDFVARVKREHPTHWTPLSGFYQLPHTDEDSTRFFNEQNKEKTKAANCKRMERWNRIVNINGYGLLW